MKVQVFQSYEDLSEKGAEELVQTIQDKPNAVICIASGHSPLRTCEIFVDLAKQRRLDVSKAYFIGLDEWIGIPPDDPGSGQSFFKKKIGEPLGIKETNYYVFDSASADLSGDCQRMDSLIARLGGIDLMIVGIGINGHIGFNEPGVSFDLRTHVIDLHPTTRQVGQKYFAGERTLQKGITLGLAHLRDTRKVLLLADGTGKASIVAKALNGPVTNDVPASILQTHANGLVLLDKAAAANLTIKYDLVG